MPDITISKTADTVKPIKPELPDPQPPFTLAQLRENLIEMEQQLDKYPLNVKRGPGWVRGILLQMLERGIDTRPDFGLLADAEALADELEAVRKERDALQAITASACLKIAGLSLSLNKTRNALRPFAGLLTDDGLENIGGGTLISTTIKVQMVKEAKAALT